MPPMTRFSIGGDVYGVQDASTSYSLTNPDPQTLQFSIQPGDHAWFDGSSVDRSEIMWAGSAGSTSTQYIPPGTPTAIDYQFAVQPNGPNNTFTNTAWFFVTAEMHDGGTVSGTSPPFAIQLAGDHLQLVARYVQPGGNPSNHHVNPPTGNTISQPVISTPAGRIVSHRAANATKF